ncbi:MAG: hypothetical protein ACXAC6_15005 [Candidatus Hodarchaeales archaeon]|jgi:hypothetical protein
MKNLKISRLWLILFFSLFLALPLIGSEMNGIASITTENAEDPFPLFDRNQTLEMAFVFINYDTGILDFVQIENYLLDELWGYETFDYFVNYSFYEANSSYEQDLMTFVNNVADTDAVTSKLNMTSLEDQAGDGHLRDIFSEQNGTAIPAEELEEWFHDHPYESSSDYCYYILNLTKFDTADHSEEHWFTAEEINPDTGIQRHWWRNEWDFPINFDAKFPYAGYGQKYRDYFFDPTSYQWYTQWYYLWNNINTFERHYSEMDLDEFMSIGADANDYIEQWIFDIVLFQHYIPNPVYGANISIDLVVFHNVSHLGLNTSDLEWVVNETEIKEAFSELAPNSELTLRITFENWTDYPVVELYFDDAEINPQGAYNGDPPIPDYNYYDGFFLFEERLWRSGFAGNFFIPATLSEVNVTGYAFILDNATLAAPGIWSGGGIYTGLGGDGQIIQLMELDRLFYPNYTVPRQGFTEVIIHEAGHAVGYPHTFGNEICVSDFIGDVMGYYPGSSRYSKVRIEAFQRQAMNIRAVNVTNNLILLANEDFSSIVLENVTLVKEYQDQIIDLRGSHSYVAAWDKIIELEELLRDIIPEKVDPINIPFIEINAFTVSVGVILGLFVLYEGAHFIRRRS